MSDHEDAIDRHAAELVRLTMEASDAETPLPEDEVARLGGLIAVERQCLIDAIGALLEEDEPEAAARPGVAEFDAGFRYGLQFARALENAKEAMARARRGRVLKLVR